MIRWVSFLSLALGACSSPLDIGNDEEKVAVVDSYHRDFAWTAPDECQVYLDKRVTDQEARLVEYATRVGDADTSIVYWFDETAPRPVRVDVIGASGSTLSAELDANSLVVFGANGAPALEVDGYGRGRDDTIVRSLAPIDEDALLALARCALPLRTELGPIPPFLRNLDTPGRIAENPDVSQGTSEAPPILSWNGPVSILGALLLQAACTRSDGWECPCLEWSDQTYVEGWCAP